MKKYYQEPLTEIVNTTLGCYLQGTGTFEGAGSDPEQGEVDGPTSNVSNTFDEDALSSDINKSGLWDN